MMWTSDSKSAGWANATSANNADQSSSAMNAIIGFANLAAPVISFGGLRQFVRWWAGDEKDVVE